MLLQKDNMPQLANGLSLGSSVHIIRRASNKWNLFSHRPLVAKELENVLVFF